MSSSVDLDSLRALIGTLRELGVTCASFNDDGALASVTLSAAAMTPSPEATKEADPLRPRRSYYENLYQRPVDNTELERLP